MKNIQSSQRAHFRHESKQMSRQRRGSLTRYEDTEEQLAYNREQKISEKSAQPKIRSGSTKIGKSLHRQKSTHRTASARLITLPTQKRAMHRYVEENAKRAQYRKELIIAKSPHHRSPPSTTSTTSLNSLKTTPSTTNTTNTTTTATTTTLTTQTTTPPPKDKQRKKHWVGMRETDRFAYSAKYLPGKETINVKELSTFDHYPCERIGETNDLNRNIRNVQQQNRRAAAARKATEIALKHAAKETHSLQEQQRVLRHEAQSKLTLLEHTSTQFKKMIEIQREKVQPSIATLLSYQEEMMGCHEALQDLQALCSTTHSSDKFMNKIRASGVGILSLRNKKVYELEYHVNHIMKSIGAELLHLENTMFDDNVATSSVRCEESEESEESKESDGDIFKTYDQPGGWVQGRSGGEENDNKHDTRHRSTFASFSTSVPDTPPPAILATPEHEIDMLARRFVLGGRSPKGRRGARKSLNSTKMNISRSSLLGGRIGIKSTTLTAATTNKSNLSSTSFSNTITSPRHPNHHHPAPSSPTIYSRKSPNAERIRKRLQEKRRNNSNNELDSGNNGRTSTNAIEIATLKIKFRDIMNTLRSAINIRDGDLFQELNYVIGISSSSLRHASSPLSKKKKIKINSDVVSYAQFHHVLSMYLETEDDIVFLFDILDTRGARCASIAEMSLALHTKWIPSSRAAYLTTTSIHNHHHQDSDNDNDIDNDNDGGDGSRSSSSSNGGDSTPFSRCQHVYASYSSPTQGMSLLQWASFVRDARILDNYLSFDVALSVFDYASQTIENDNLNDSAEKEHVRIDELSWFQACHCLLSCKMYKRGHYGEEDYLGPEEWKSDVCVMFDDLFIRPLVSMLNMNIKRPISSCRWLGSLYCILEVCVTHVALYKACFLVIAQLETEIKQNQRTEQDAQNAQKKEREIYNLFRNVSNNKFNLGFTKSDLIWELDVPVSKSTVISFFKYIGITGNVLDEKELSNIFHQLHHHTTFHGKQTHQLLFPEFCEVIISIGSHMMMNDKEKNKKRSSSNNGGNRSEKRPTSPESGVGLSSKLERINTYLNGNVILLSNIHQSRTEEMQERIKDMQHEMRRERSEKAFL